MGKSLQGASVLSNKSCAKSRDDRRRALIEPTSIDLIRRCASGEKTRWFARLCDNLSPHKSAAVVAHLTGEQIRTCYDWSSGSVSPPARVLVKLLHSHIGWEVLSYIMRGCEEDWWRDVLTSRYRSAAIDMVDSRQLTLKFNQSQDREAFPVG